VGVNVTVEGMHEALEGQDPKIVDTTVDGEQVSMPPARQQDGQEPMTVLVF